MLTFITEFFLDYVNPFLRQMFTVVIIVIGQINEIILGKKYHSGSTYIALAGNYADTAFQPPTVGNFIHRKKFVKILLGDLIPIVAYHIVKKIIYRETQLADQYALYRFCLCR